MPAPKLTKAAARYRQISDPRHSCHVCRFRIDQGAQASTCQKVHGTVDREHVCDLFKPEVKWVFTTQVKEWDESEHPRDDRGRFGDGSGGVGTSQPLTLTPDADTKASSDKFQSVCEDQSAASSRSDAKAKIASDLANSFVAKYGTKYDEQLFRPYQEAAGAIVHSAAAQPYIRDNHDGTLEVTYETPDTLQPRTGPLADILNQIRLSKVPMDSDAARDMMRTNAMSKMVQMWAGSSNDANPDSLAMQEAATEEFGLKDSAPWTWKGDSSSAMATMAGSTSGTVEPSGTDGKYTKDDINALVGQHVEVTTGKSTFKGVMWGTTSKGGDLQVTVGLGGPKAITKSLDIVKSVSVSGLEDRQGLYRTFVRNMYENTQKYLAQNGIKALTVYRGVHGGVAADDDSWGDLGGAEGYGAGMEQVEGAHTGDTIEAQLRPMSSWSTSQDTAQKFSGSSQGGGRILTATVPASRIIGTPFTGTGCMSESEVVILGGKDRLGIAQGAPDEKRSDKEIEDEKQTWHNWALIEAHIAKLDQQ